MPPYATSPFYCMPSVIPNVAQRNEESPIKQVPVNPVIYFTAENAEFYAEKSENVELILPF
jgi:hypothetical protein